MPSPFRRVLIAYDGSQAAKAALGYALALARDGAGVTILHAVNEEPIVAQSTTMVTAFDPAPLTEALEQAGNALLDDAVAVCRASGVEATVVLARDAPVDAIVAGAQSAGCDLIAIGTNGHGALERAFVGSTAMGVLRASEIPVLLVHPEAPAPGDTPPFRHVLVALDGSEPAEAAAALAARLASEWGSALVLCNVALSAESIEPNRALVAETARRFGLPPATPVEVVEGRPAEELLAAAERHGADALLLGSHGRRGIARLVLGSVAEGVASHGVLPALVVRR